MRVEQRVAGRIPHAGVGAIEDAGQLCGAMREQAIQSATELGRADFRGIGRTHRGQRIGVNEPRFDEREATMEFQRLH